MKDTAKWIKLGLGKALSLCKGSLNFLVGNMEENPEINSPYQSLSQ